MPRALQTLDPTTAIIWNTGRKGAKARAGPEAKTGAGAQDGAGEWLGSEGR